MASLWCIRSYSPSARTVAENIWLGTLPPQKYGPVTTVDQAKIAEDTDDLLKLRLEIDSHEKLGSR